MTKHEQGQVVEVDGGTGQTLEPTTGFFEREHARLEKVALEQQDMLKRLETKNLTLSKTNARLNKRVQQMERVAVSLGLVLMDGMNTVEQTQTVVSPE